MDSYLGIASAMPFAEFHERRAYRRNPAEDIAFLQFRGEC
jgi:hypothetical protein